MAMRRRLGRRVFHGDGVRPARSMPASREPHKSAPRGRLSRPCGRARAATCGTRGYHGCPAPARPLVDGGRALRTVRLAMAARSIASLTLSFGLVSIPVKLYSATEIVERGQVQPAGQGRLAPEAAVRVGEGPDRRAARRDGQGLRVREGPLRAVLGRGAEGAGRSQQPGDRDHGLHPREVGRPAVLRQGLPDRARQARRQALCAARRGDAQERPLRAGQVGLEGQAVRGAGAAGRRRPGAAAAAVRRRGAFAEGSEHRAGGGVRRRTAAGAAADRPDLRGRLRPDAVRRRGEEAHPRRDRREDRRQAGGGLGARRGAGARPRSST